MRPCPHMLSDEPVTLGDEVHPALRSDIRELGVVLGQRLVRQEGPETLELVERVRRLSREDREGAAALLDGVGAETATRLVRAFSTFFHLANIAEQVHRARSLAALRAERGTWLSQAVERIAAADVGRDELQAEVDRLGVRPVFTAHPTEAARRTVLTKLRRIGALLDERARTTDAAAERRIRRRLEELVDV